MCIPRPLQEWMCDSPEQSDVTGGPLAFQCLRATRRYLLSQQAVHMRGGWRTVSNRLNLLQTWVGRLRRTRRTRRMRRQKRERLPATPGTRLMRSAAHPNMGRCTARTALPRPPAFRSGSENRMKPYACRPRHRSMFLRQCEETTTVLMTHGSLFPHLMHGTPRFFFLLQSFAYQTTVAPRVEAICSCLFRRRLTAVGDQTGHPEGQALSGDKAWSSLRLHWLGVALACLDILHSATSNSKRCRITLVGRGGYA